MIKHDTMEQYVADRTPAPVQVLSTRTGPVHIHQGGTVRAYCGRPLAMNSRVVAWEEADKATCEDCQCGFVAGTGPATAS